MITPDLRSAVLSLSALTLALSISPSLLAESITEGQTELIQNGSFENYTVTKNSSKRKLAQLDGWQGTGEVWTNLVGKAATTGDHKIELDVAAEHDSLSQIVMTEAGQKYRLNLDSYGRKSNTSDFEILLDDEVISTIKPDNQWQTYSVYFIGNGQVQTLTLKELSAQNNNKGALIDNVSLTTSRELLSNGSFEDFEVTTNNGRWKLVNLANWEGAAEVWVNKKGLRSTNGNYKAELDVLKEADSLSQTITTQERFIYEVSLDAYAREANTSDFEIWVDDQKLQTITPTSEWQRYSTTFVGNGQAQRLSIKELSSQNNKRGALIDNVSMVDTGSRENSTPSLTGVPSTKVNLGESYYFKPVASDTDETDTLSFSITNKPEWATFNTATGELSGTPTEQSTTSNIQISVSDDIATTSLAAFTIKAREIVNIAREFGEVSQGGSYDSNSGANYAVDGDASTFNHTTCNADENWWQVKLPSPTSISSFSIQSRSTWTSRISGATVYLSDTAYSGSSNEADLVATLSATSDAQVTQLEAARSANYLIVKAETDNCLHIAEVEVYGDMPEAPILAEHENNYLVAGNSAAGTTLATLSSTDYQGDSLSYSVLGDSPFNIDAQGNLSAAKTLTAGSYAVTVEVSDGEYTTQTTLTINVTSDTAVEDALISGDASLVTTAELIPVALAEVARLQNGPTAISALYDENSIEYTPGNRTQLLKIKGDVDQIWPLLQGTNGNTLAAAGLTGTSRFAAFGSVPMEFFQEGTSLSYEAPFKNLLAWLFAGDSFTPMDLESPRTIALSFTSGDAQDIKDWISANFTNWTVQDCNDASALSACYSNADLVITGWQAENTDTDNVVQALSSAGNSGTPILYLHTWYEAYNDVAHGIADLLGFDLSYGGNYWSDDSANWADVTEMQAAINQSTGYDALERLLTHFDKNDFSVDLASCDSSCSNVESYETEFEKAADTLRDKLEPLDQKNLDLFAGSAHRLEKLLLLLGDKYRQATIFPMDKTATDPNQFLQALFADYSVYSSRSTNPVQADMGNFSRSDFSHITPTTKTITLESKNDFRAAGVYALPGQTVTVTRNDSSEVATSIFINTQRSASTHLFQEYGYKRPKFLKSNLVEIQPGETISLTSPYGGPLQISFDSNDLPVSFTFNNIGEHPFWNDSSDNDRFEQQLAAGDYDWAELVTPGFEIHSSLDKMRSSMNDSKWGNAVALADATMRYMHNFPHALAGLQGPGIDPIPELHDFADANGWTINTLDMVQHMNADQATCGYGCSGNPYDAYWAYSPVGHGDVHELGHGLQGSRRFGGWENHTMTNYYSYFTKSQYYKDTGGDPVCQSLPFESMFDVLQASVNEEDSAAYIQANLWDKMGWSEGAGMFIQMMMAAQEDGALNDGWLLRGRLHMLEREFDRAKQSETLWDEKRASLGFSQYSLSEVESMDDNDWYLIAISYVTARNFTDYFDMWAMPYSIKADSQVTALNYAMMPQQYFKSDAEAYCLGLDKPAIAIDGVQSW